MRIGLLDPAWVEKRKLEIQKKKDEEDYYAPNVQVADALKRLAPKDRVAHFSIFRKLVITSRILRIPI